MSNGMSEKAACEGCGGLVPPGDEGRLSGLCQTCLNGPVPTSDSAATAGWHQPVVARLSDGRWGVHCDACSREALDYVYPCKVDTTHPDAWPPATLEAK